MSAISRALSQRSGYVDWLTSLFSLYAFKSRGGGLPLERSRTGRRCAAIRCRGSLRTRPRRGERIGRSNECRSISGASDNQQPALFFECCSVRDYWRTCWLSYFRAVGGVFQMIDSEGIARFFLIGLAISSLSAMPVFISGLIWKLRHIIN